MTFHKIIKNRLLGWLTDQRNPIIKDNQYAFQKNALILAKYEVEKMREDGLTIITLDVKNAFNSVPHEAVFQMMDRAGINHMLQNYIR